jgi:oligopeptide/dipeptide ABC transporter ATP-binding protein
MMFQDPYASLNPRHTVGKILAAPFEIQKSVPPSGVHDEVAELMARVGLDPAQHNRYPHEFSGGQRQRIGIARAIALRPKLIVCDEPVSALDVSIQAQIVNLLADLRDEFGMAYVFVAHDLAVVRHISDRVAVMYLGRIVELADSDSLYTAASHPYTQALLSAVPVPNPSVKRERILLRGDAPDAAMRTLGCRFRARCPRYRDNLTEGERAECESTDPLLTTKTDTHLVACHHAS